MDQGVLIEPIAINRQALIALIRKWGGVNSDGLLDETCKIFTVDGLEGFIGYKSVSTTAVVFGDPVCSPENKAAFALAFQSFCETQNIEIIYTMTSDEFTDWALENLKATSIEFGENFVLDPQNDPLNHSGPNGVLVRKKVKHALKDGITAKEYFFQDKKDTRVEQGISEVESEWLQKRHGPQIYLTHLNLFNDSSGKRYIYGEKNGKIIGLLILNSLQAKKGWLLNNLMIAKGAPSGLSELLVVTALQIVAAEGCRHVVVGPLVGHRLGKIIGMSEIKETSIRLLFRFLKFVFRLDGQRTFWNKFQHNAEGSYLIFPKGNLGISSIRALLEAFNVRNS